MVPPLFRHPVAQPEHAGADMRPMLPGGADDHRLAVPHHDALDGLHIAHDQRMEAASHFDGVAVD
jgi:hypothetical protein